MPLRIFLPYDVLGAGLWAALFCMLGYLFWRSLDKLTTYVGRGLFAFAALVVVVVAGLFAWRLRRDQSASARAWVDSSAARTPQSPLPAAACAAAAARFVWHRVTPGTLGLELTTLLALLAVGALHVLLPRHR